MDVCSVNIVFACPVTIDGVSGHPYTEAAASKPVLARILL